MTEKRLHTVFWLLLFVVFPLAYLPPEVVERFSTGLIRYPVGEQADAFVLKILVFVPTWLLGAGLVVTSVRGRRNTRLLAPGPKRVFLWCGAFAAALLVSSLFTLSYSNVTLPFVNAHAEGVLLVLFEAAWYSLAPMAAVLGARRILPLEVVLDLMVAGALAVGLWTLAEAYGLEPWSLVVPGATVGGNLAATLGHQGYVAAYLGVALVFWTVWRVQSGRVRSADVAVAAVLMASLVASGGRAGLIATVLVLLTFGLSAARFPSRRTTVLGLLVVLSAVSFGVARTSAHAQARLVRVAVAAQGEDPSVQHRLLFWRLALKAVAREPWVGYGPYSFSQVAWRVADAEDARALVGEFLPAGLAQKALRVGKLAFYQDPATDRLHVKVMNPYAVHNYLLDLSLASGLPAALLFVAYIGACVRHLRRQHSPLATAALTALTTYLIYGLFWFPTHLVDPLVWSLVGLGLVGTQTLAPKRRAVGVSKTPSGYRLGLSRFTNPTRFIK